MNVKRWVLEIKGSTRDNVAAKLSLSSVSAVQVRVYKFDDEKRAKQITVNMLRSTI